MELMLGFFFQLYPENITPENEEFLEDIIENEYEGRCSFGW